MAVQGAPRVGGGLLVTVARFRPRGDLGQQQHQQPRPHRVSPAKLPLWAMCGILVRHVLLLCNNPADDHVRGLFYSSRRRIVERIYMCIFAHPP
eukprot:scaffold46812_cov69-Phaeocystis_antarctica.AAC.3